MALTFYPHPDDVYKGSLTERVELFMEAAERYKAAVLGIATPAVPVDEKKRLTPRDQTIAFNWEGIARILRDIREMPEINKSDKLRKGELLTKLAEIYEVLRAAKMSKLEAVRLALISEANQLIQSGM